MLRTLSTLPHSVRIVEVGPRDGLQNEKAHHSNRAKNTVYTHACRCRSSSC